VAEEAVYYCVGLVAVVRYL